MAVTQSRLYFDTFQFTSLPHELRLHVMHSMDAASLFNFFQIHSDMVLELKRGIPEVTSPEELAIETFKHGPVYTMIIDREDSSWGNFEKLAERARVVGSKTLVVLRGSNPINKYVNKLLGEVLNSSCLLFLESNQRTTIDISNVVIKCEKIDLNRMNTEKFESSLIRFTNCAIHNHLVLLKSGPKVEYSGWHSCRLSLAGIAMLQEYQGIRLDFTGCPLSLYNRLEVNSLVFDIRISHYKDATVLSDLKLSGKIIETSSSLTFINVPPMKRLTFESPILRLVWNRDLGENLEGSFNTEINSNQLEEIIIYNTGMDEAEIVCDGSNVPNLMTVTFGRSDEDIFHSQDSGYGCSFLETAPIKTLRLYDTYQPLQFLDSLPKVEAMVVKLQSNIFKPVFSCQFPKLDKLALYGTAKAMEQFTFIPAPCLTILSLNISNEPGEDRVLSDESKLIDRISKSYPTLKTILVRHDNISPLDFQWGV